MGRRPRWLDQRRRRRVPAERPDRGGRLGVLRRRVGARDRVHRRGGGGARAGILPRGEDQRARERIRRRGMGGRRRDVERRTRERERSSPPNDDAAMNLLPRSTVGD
eukprot:18493-Pelagococcus_subviridis.AAC.1